MKRILLSSALSFASAMGAGAVGAQDVSAEMLVSSEAPGSLKLILADPELGVVGRYVSGNDTLYFEARTGLAKSGENQLSARLLDAQGRNIAVAGDSMDAVWLKDQHFKRESAQASQALAMNLASELDRVLSDPAFAAEREALVSLAMQTGTADLGKGRVALRLPKALPAVELSRADIEFYQRAAMDLQISRDSNGDTVGKFRDTMMEATQREFSGADGSEARIEAYARLATVAGSTLAAEFGGDEAPGFWGEKLALQAPVQGDARLDQVGEAILAAQVLSHTSSKSSTRPVVVESFKRLATSLRGNLLPSSENPGDIGSSGSAAKAVYSNKATHLQVWTKPATAVFGDHSGTYITSQYYANGRWWFDHSHTYCNHGACPFAAGTTRRCTFWGPTLSYWRDPPTLWTTQISPSWHSCSTSYHVFSPSNGHNCNDDSWTQLRAIKGTSYSSWGYRCNDGAFYAHAPQCASD